MAGSAWSLVTMFSLMIVLTAMAVLPRGLLANGYSRGWIAGRATWYGDPHGEGSSGGGACGYQKLAGTPYTASISAGSGAIFQKGMGCGQCYDVMCSDPCCCKNPTRIVITDFCPGGTYCSTGQPSFNLSGAAISKVALPGKDGEMRGFGLYNIQYKRVPCRYPGQNIAFKVDTGSSAFWFAFTVKYVAGSGDIGSVAIRQAGSSSFQAMQHNWGANWKINSYSGIPFRAPLDVKITSRLSGRSVIAKQVIPQNFQPGALYTSKVQFAC